jgi:outer membrane protein TolC
MDALLESFIRDALQARPELAEGRATVAAERERIPQAAALPDPVLTLGIQNDSFTQYSIGKMETSWYTVMLTQSLPWPSKPGLRRDVARLQPALADAALARVGLSVVAEVRRAYVDLILVRDQLQLLDVTEALWRKSAAAAKVQYAVGQAPQSDLLRAELEVTRLQQRRLALESAERLRVEALNRARGHALDQAIPATPTLETLGTPTFPTAAEMQAESDSRSPELLQARLSTQQAERRAALARAERYPDLSVSAGVMPRGSLDPMWAVTLGVTLPVFAGQKQNRAVAEAVARRESASRGADAVRQLLHLRVEQRRTLLEALARTNKLYRDGVLIQSEATTNSTLAEYAVGRVPFAAVLDALGGYLADKSAYLASMAQAHRIVIAQLELSLDEPSEVSAEMARNPSMSAKSMTGGTMPTPSGPTNASPAAQPQQASSGMGAM